MECCKMIQETHDSLSEFALHAIETTMGSIGRFTVKRPCGTITGSFIFMLIMSSGFMFLGNETEADNLYAPEGTRSQDEQDKWDVTFGSRSNVYYPMDSIFYSAENNVYTQDVMNRFETFYNKVIELQTTHDGHTYSFTNGICYNDTATGACDVSGPYSSLRFNKDNFGQIQIYNSDLQQDPQTYNLLPTLSFIGKPIWENSVLTEARAVRLSYGTFLYPQNHPGYESHKKAAEKYWDDYLDLCEELRGTLENGDLRFTYYSDSSIDIEGAKAVGGDIGLFVFAIIIICILAVVFNYRTNWVENKMWVAWPGLISTCFAIPCAFGVLGWTGIKSNPVVAVAPFLLLGIGVDDMFVLIRAFDLTPKDASVERRIVMTMEGAGVGIFFTSVTDFLAFMIGYASPYPAIRAFCVFSGTGVLFDFIFQCTLFLSFLTFQAERERDGKFTSFPFCCCRCSPDNDNHDVGGSELMTPSNSIDRKEVRMQRMSSLRLTGDINSHFNPDETNDAFTKYVNTLLEPMVSGCVAVIFVVWLAMAAYGLATIPVGQRIQDLAPEGSYLIDYLDAQEEYYDQLGGQVMFVMKDQLNYWDTTVQTKVTDMMSIAETGSCGSPNTSTIWIREFTAYANNASSPTITNTEATFISALQNWLDDPEEGSRFKGDILFNNPDTRDSIFATKTSFNQRPPTNDEIEMEALADCLSPLRHIADNAGLGEVFIYYESAKYAESVLIILKQTLLTLSYAALSAWIICLILIPSLKLSVIVMLVVVSILLGVLGYLSFWGYRVDTVISVNLVMTIGFAVDNAAHIAHAYYHSMATTRAKKVSDALNLVGIPILMGDLTTVLALVPLLFSSSIIFKSFFACIFLVMTFGAASALLFLPVLLCYLGPEVDHSAALANMKGNTSRSQIDLGPDNMTL